MKRIVLLVYPICIFLFSCQPSTADFDPNFVLCLFNKDESPTTLLFLDNLDEANEKSFEIAMPTHRIREREYMYSDGFFYRLSGQPKVFTKFRVAGKSLVVVDSISLGITGVETISWKDKDHLITVSREDSNDSVSYARICEINTKEMMVEKDQKVLLPHANKELWQLHVGLVDYQNGQLWLAYSFFKTVGKYGHTTSDLSYYATLDYDSLTMVRVEEESRSTYPGGFNLIQSYSFKDEHGDYYFMTNPGIALGNNVKLPTAIFRKKNGQHLVDQDYMINISEKIGNHAYGIWYVGDGKAVVRNEQKSLFTNFSDYHSAYQFEYQLVDLESGEIEKIQLPLDKGTQKDNVWSDGEQIYIAIDDVGDRHRIWKYNVKNHSISEGIELPKATNFTVRLSYLK